MFPRDPEEPKLVAWVRNPRVRRTVILSILWLFIGGVIVGFRFVLLPFGLAVLLAFILEPLVGVLTRRRIFGRPIPRAAAVIGVYVISLGLLSLFGSWAVAQIGREIAKVGAVSAKLIKDAEPMVEEVLSRAVKFADENSIPVDRDQIETFFRENVASLRDELTHNTAKILSVGRDVVGATLRVVFGLFLVLMLTAFLSIDRARIERFFHSLVPPEHQDSYRTILSGMSVGLAGVVRGQVLICLTNGVLTFFGLWLLGVKLPLLLATVATTFSLIPIFGSILSTIPIVAIALTDSLAKGLFALLWIIGIHLVEANLLNPKIMGGAAKIHPVIVVFALIVGERTSGLIGALFAVPIASVVLTLFKFLHARALAGVREAIAEGRIAVAESSDIPPAETTAAPPRTPSATTISNEPGAKLNVPPAVGE